MSFRIGTIAYSSNTGLGYQTRDLVKHLKPSKVLIDDLSAHNGMPVDHSWCPNARVVQHNDFVRNNSYEHNEHIEWLTDDVDIILICETPLNHALYSRAREKGVKTIQIFNAEFIDGYRHPDWPRADYMAAPTSWHNDQIRELDMGEVISWPVAVDRAKFGYRPIMKLETFIHVIGRPTYLDRNGTLTFLEATRILGDKYEYKVFLQQPQEQRANEHFLEVQAALEQSNVEIVYDTPNPQDIYKQGEVLVLPRRYGGLCLPMQEALSCGLPVIMTDITPNTDRLPLDWLIPAQFQDSFFFHAPVDVYDSNPQDLAETMEKFANPDYMLHTNRLAHTIANRLSWGNLKPYYLETLERCLK